MENLDVSTNMTTGVAMPVNNNPTQNSPEVKSTEIQELDAPEIIEIENIDKVLIEDESVSTSELLLKAAKEEGFEKALTDFANDESEEKLPEEKTDDDKDETVEGEEVEEEEVMEVKTPEELFEEERIQLVERVNTLEEKVGELMEETKQLSEKVKSAEETAQLSREMMLQMFALLYEMIKKEEDEKKKVSFLEILIDFIGKFMQTLVDPEKELNKEEKPVSQEPKDSSNTSPDIEKIMQLLEKRTGENHASASEQQPIDMPKNTEVSLVA